MEFITAMLPGFLGSATLRWLLGEALTFFKARQERKQELETMRLQFEQEKERRVWVKEEIAAASERETALVRVKADAAHDAAANKAILTSIEQLEVKSGVGWVDGWNHAIRPGLATAGVLMLVLEFLAPNLVTMADATRSVVESALGLYVGGRMQRTGR